ncbi:hypothetical protein AB0M95_27220 [Sphaerisporangium sp. NPDC051017]|uniref:hypothetical protein n=1 Tax=Sphaerisporangium sp. NPDC051017 TaxID=3154636 RepID=UPI0034366706
MRTGHFNSWDAEEDGLVQGGPRDVGGQLQRSLELGAALTRVEIFSEKIWR